MSTKSKADQKNVISLEKYLSKRGRKPLGLTHTQVIGDPDPPTARVWLQGNVPKASLENIAPASASKLLFVALSMCIELAVIAQQNAGVITQGIDLSS